MEMMFFGIIIIMAVALLMKWINARYNIRQSCKRKDAISKYNIMDEKVSYDRYKKVAHKTSVRNTPVRTHGDFWDFILPFLRNPSKKYLEDRLSCVDCGDEDE
ncbi:MAG: hypothetical protein NC489_36825 [Ruminococcus flavefaciens]|nr:hypothetical protein [Ruminococcus flavefaciens]